MPRVIRNVSLIAGARPTVRIASFTRPVRFLDSPFKYSSTINSTGIVTMSLSGYITNAVPVASIRKFGSTCFSVREEGEAERRGRGVEQLTVEHERIDAIL